MIKGIAYDNPQFIRQSDLLQFFAVKKKHFRQNSDRSDSCSVIVAGEIPDQSAEPVYAVGGIGSAAGSSSMVQATVHKGGDILRSRIPSTSSTPALQIEDRFTAARVNLGLQGYMADPVYLMQIGFYLSVPLLHLGEGHVIHLDMGLKVDGMLIA